MAHNLRGHLPCQNGFLRLSRQLARAYYPVYSQRCQLCCRSNVIININRAPGSYFNRYSLCHVTLLTDTQLSTM